MVGSLHPTAILTCGLLSLGLAWPTAACGPGAPAESGPAGGSAGDESSEGLATEGDTNESGPPGEDDGLPRLDVGPPDVAAQCPSECTPAGMDGPGGPWLLRTHGAWLSRVWVEAGENDELQTDLCKLQGASGEYLSLTFTRDDRLLASTGSFLDEIDPCSCEATPLGPLDPGGVFGIAPDEGVGLYGLSAGVDSLVHIDPDGGPAVEVVGPLGVEFATHGATLAPEEDRLLAILGLDVDELVEVDLGTGQATPLGDLAVDFGDVGMERHPENDSVYACNTFGQLYRIALDGGAEPLGSLGSLCTNLGAPWDGDALCLPAG